VQDGTLVFANEDALVKYMMLADTRMGREEDEQVVWEQEHSFVSLRSIQNGAVPSKTTASVYEVEDPALAAALSSEGRMIVGDLVITLDTAHVWIETRTGNPVADYAIESNEIVPTLGKQLAADRDRVGYGHRNDPTLYQMTGKVWSTNYGFYASVGAYTRNEKWRSGRYRDSEADYLTLDCDLRVADRVDGNVGPVYTDTRFWAKTNATEVQKYFDQAFAFPIIGGLPLPNAGQNVIGVDLITCDHFVRKYNETHAQLDPASGGMLLVSTTTVLDL
jgi:hypothetical protein